MLDVSARHTIFTISLVQQAFIIIYRDIGELKNQAENSIFPSKWHLGVYACIEYLLQYSE